ncbi:radical SAM family heme chaperone HemW [Amylibacter sp.]|jgi:putative oxygen-independent coproporphyrinogen III oxidase|nr:coproporphyrinogen III oxidase [Rhodobacterales bacterium]MDA9089132.1 radical SAM family heme chaperone HemW [Amylibacter sp.]MDA9277773.1 radical SAM family heme chaperone HemW [Amylibacter sp.]MDA9283061.1 radical SAM family heme chaperone HemW [Amylibacter sp.]MDA9369485.1 radical SAM family heme chaperone HemW [Amylibacter sp.]|tara:strand:+ start:2745 stop:3899 length:1155 start_codon:yes stop_codon:yes gene_type:complete
MDDWENGGFGIYIHWPFCAAKCPYCDFNSHVRKSVDQSRWLSAIRLELKNNAIRTKGRTVNTIFFGGGTPSLMEPETVAGIIKEIAKLWVLALDIEISLEANPTSVEAQKFSDFRKAGINRISMGIQSLRNDDLKALGRMHSVNEARKAFDIAKDNFERVSFDLIYARQGQSKFDWEIELKEASSMAVDHLSLYQLTIEDGTRFGDLYERGNLKGMPNDSLAADMYDITQEVTLQNDMPAYEISNHAIEGAESRHNLIYWRYGDYIGVGPGAHGRISENGNKIATTTIENPENWLRGVELNGTSTIDDEVINHIDQASEYLMMSLRLIEGVDMERYKKISGVALDNKLIDKNIENGLITVINNNLIATQRGRIILNTLIKDLLI